MKSSIMEGNSLLLSSQAYQQMALPTFAGAERTDSTQLADRTNSTNTSESSKALPQDIVSLSPQARRQASQPNKSLPNQNDQGNTSQPSTAAEGELSADDLRELQELKRRDTEVRAHEQAHLSVAGQHAAGGASFSYEVGPNGKRYATEGEVPIDMSKGNTPEETLLKMQQIRKAALAPASPSAADRRIADRAAILAAQAQREIQEESSPETKVPGAAASTSSSSNQAPEAPSSEDGRASQNERFISSADRYMILQQYQAQL